ncbi:MAG: TonB-dependent receptor [Gemmatimonadaceae bacterium]
MITGLSAGFHTIRARLVGFAEATRNVNVAAGQTTTIDFVLGARVVQLEELVVVGYGTVRRKDLTGAIGSARGEDLATGAAPAVSVANALVGRVPGVQVVSNLGTPGASATVRIRGTNSISANNNPLYVVDGIPLSTALNSVDPNNIESLQILKDASATAIYGARGANGVVLITTKRGTRGTNQVTLETGYGVQRPSTFLPALSAPEFMTLVNEGLVNAGRVRRYTDAQIAGAQSYDYPRLLLSNLQWQPQQTHSLSVSGGDEKSRYLMSGNYVQQRGIIINSGFDRASSRVNLDREVSDHVRVGASLSGARTSQSVNGAVATGTGNSDTGLTTAIQYDPSIAPLDSLGRWNKRVVLSENFLNPYTETANRHSPSFNTALLTTFFGEYDIGTAIQFRSTVGGNFSFGRSPSYSPRFIASGNEIGVASQYSSEGRELTNENTVIYRRAVGRGHLDVLAGASIQTSHFESFRAEARGFPVDALEYNNLGGGFQLVAPSSGTSDWVLLSQLGRINYNWLDRYLFTITARRDGSSRFGANNKWAVFPSAAFAWRVSDESFMKRQSLFQDLKLRVSYGRTGNQAINEYQSLDRLNTGFTGLGTGTDAVYIVPQTGAANPNLKWETQDQFNTGLDMALLSNRLSLTVDAYQSKTTNLLLSRDLVWTTGFTSQLQNVGAVRNRGLEIGLRTLNVTNDRVTWETTLSIAANRNEVTELYGGLKRLGAGSGTQVGQPLGTFVGYKVLGIYQPGDPCALIAVKECTPGEYKILDADRNGVINDDDRVNLGNGQPSFHGGFSSNLRYGALTLDANFNFSAGNKINNTSLRYIGLVGGQSNELRNRSLRRWTPTNMNTDVPRANIDRVGNRTYSTYIEDGSFLRLQMLQIAYRIPPRFVPRADAARFTVTGQNLWITTPYSGWDPEQQAVDPGGYPRARTWNMGLSLTY